MIGEYTMSLVQFVLTYNFILVGGDTRGTDINQNIVSETHNKVMKINPNIIIGCSGIAQDAYLLLSNYCTFSREYGLHLKDSVNLKYEDIISSLNKKFDGMCQIHYDSENETLYDFTVVVCGFNGDEFMAMQYSISDNLYEKDNGRHPIYINPKTGLRCFMIGSFQLELHNKNYNDELRKNQPETILQYKNIMKTVFDKGVKFDRTINNLCVFEKIKRKDVIENR